MDTGTVQGSTRDCYWMERPDGWWVEVTGLSPREMTELLVGRKAHWLTMTASPCADGVCRLVYSWDVAGRTLNVATTIAEPRVDSVADLLPAAAPAEREIRERFAVEFACQIEAPSRHCGARTAHPVSCSNDARRSGYAPTGAERARRRT